MESNLLKLTGLSLVVLHNPDAQGNAPEYTALLAPSAKREDGASDDKAPKGTAF